MNLNFIMKLREAQYGPENSAQNMMGTFSKRYTFEKLSAG